MSFASLKRKRDLTINFHQAFTYQRHRLCPKITLEKENGNHLFNREYAGTTHRWQSQKCQCQIRKSSELPTLDGAGLGCAHSLCIIVCVCVEQLIFCD